MPGQYYNQSLDTTVNHVAGSFIWVIVSIVIAIIGGLVLYFVFVKPEKETTNKYLLWFKEFFAFKKMLIEDLLKVTYLILAIFITLSSFALIASSFIGFLVTLIVGNLILRVIYESCIITIMIWKNTTEINKKLKK